MKNCFSKICVAAFSFASAAFIFTGCSTVTPKSAPPSTPVPSTPGVEVKKPLPPPPKKVPAKKITIEEITFKPELTSQKIIKVIEAYKVYNSSKGKATGVYEYQNLVFVIVNVDYGKEKINQRLAKGTAMLRAKKLLQTTYKLPAKFNLRTNQLEARNIQKQKLYRYAFVANKSDINAAKAQPAPVKKAVVPAKKAAPAPVKKAVVPAKTKSATVKKAVAPAKAQPVPVKKAAAVPVKKAVAPAKAQPVPAKKAVAPAKKSSAAVKSKKSQAVKMKTANTIVVSGDVNVDDDF